ncbi:MAG: sigma-70 family RNA polymerase sigma factor [Flavobacteriaceae bacterium]|nr:sigma-70 family RNA polymerase sigma factor [Flavobacteriaceae bacterium]
MESNEVHIKIDHLFRQESGKMVSVLVNIFGSSNIELAEDVVQNTLIKALEVWKYKGIPDNPSGWLYRVARNNALDIIRREKRSELFDFSDPKRQLLTSEYTLPAVLNNFWETEQIEDDFLGMMFACCHPEISKENQVTFILKTLCGFSTKEVARSFITTDDIISKRIYRTKEHFRKNQIYPTIPTGEELESKLGVICSVIYLMFNAGYSASHNNMEVREEVISQALFLGKALLDNKKTNYPEVYALMAVMCFHSARLKSRSSDQNEQVLLANQDRTKWNVELINLGLSYLVKANEGNRISMYHYEAFIAREHCISPNYEATNWNAILSVYDQMLTHKFDPIVYLNRTLALMEPEGPKKALVEMKKVAENKHLKKYSLYHAALGEIYLRLDNHLKQFSI